MNKPIACFVAAFALLDACTACAQTGGALGQQVVGVWTLASQYVERPDGSRVERFGASPKGLAFFDRGGRFSMVMFRPDLPKVASNNALTATDAENRAITQGSTAFFGTWSVDEATGTMLNRVEGSTYPNWDGTELKRTLAFSGDDMKVCVPSQIGGTSCATWRRAR